MQFLLMNLLMTFSRENAKIISFGFRANPESAGSSSGVVCRVYI